MLNKITPVVLNIIIINVLVFLFINMNLDKFTCDYNWDEFFLLFKVDWVLQHDHYCSSFYPWQYITSMFSHVDLMHLVFNMFGLFSLGTAVERVIHQKRFLALYLFSGLLGAIFTSIFDPSSNPVLGASGAIFGVVVAFAFYYPNARLQMMFIPIGFKPSRLVIGATAISLFLIVFNLIAPGGRQILGSISHFGHLAGIAGGFIFIYGPRLLNKMKS